MSKKGKLGNITGSCGRKRRNGTPKKGRPFVPIANTNDGYIVGFAMSSSGRPHESVCLTVGSYVQANWIIEVYHADVEYFRGAKSLSPTQRKQIRNKLIELVNNPHSDLIIEYIEDVDCEGERLSGDEAESILETIFNNL